jgi:hypothetical protein
VIFDSGGVEQFEMIRRSRVKSDFFNHLLIGLERIVLVLRGACLLMRVVL